MKEHFPRALTGPKATGKFIKALVDIGFTPENTLYADSSCPDEINHDDPSEDITGLMQHHWGAIFPLSGLAGVPFAGATGWAAFSSHIPKDGNCVVLFAPHVGVHTDGTIGIVKREGQEHTTSACGAAIGALKALRANPKTAQNPGMIDQQMDTIKHLLLPHVDAISRAENE